MDGEHGRCCPSSEQPRNGVGVAANAEPEARELALTGIAGEPLGYRDGPGGPSASRSDADLHGERAAERPMAGE